MSFIISTTSDQQPLIINDLGAATFEHPTVNYDLELIFPIEDILNSTDMATAIDNGWVIVVYDNIPITAGIQLRPYLMRSGIKPMEGDLDMNFHNIINWAGGGGGGTSVNVTNADTTPGVLNDKIQAGSNIVATVINPGGNEKLRIDAIIGDIDGGSANSIYLSQQLIDGGGA